LLYLRDLLLRGGKGKEVEERKGRERKRNGRGEKGSGGLTPQLGSLDPPVAMVLQVGIENTQDTAVNILPFSAFMQLLRRQERHSAASIYFCGPGVTPWKWLAKQVSVEEL